MLERTQKELLDHEKHLGAHELFRSTGTTKNLDEIDNHTERT